MKKLSKISVQTIFFVCASALLTLVTSCDSQLPLNSFQSNITRSEAVTPEVAVAEADPDPVVPDNVAAPVILNRAQVPILCYHQIRDWSPSDSKRARDYIVPINNFREQIKLLADLARMSGGSAKIHVLVRGDSTITINVEAEPEVVTRRIAV